MRFNPQRIPTTKAVRAIKPDSFFYAKNLTSLLNRVIMSVGYVMQTVHQIVDIKQLSSLIDIPVDMQGKVEITITPVKEVSAESAAKKPNREVLKKIWEITKKHADPSLIPFEKQAWALAVSDSAAKGKYDPQYYDS
jgi:hypothetical protein